MPPYKKRTYKKKARAKAVPKGQNGWSVGADLGVFGNYTASRMYKRSLPSLIKHVVDGDKEVKRKLIQVQASALSNTHLTRNLLGNIAVGTSTLQRESQEVKLSILKGAFTFRAIWASQVYPTMLRSILVRSKVEALQGTDAYGSGLGSTDLYLNNTLSLNPTTSMMDPKKSQILFEKITTFGFANGANPFATQQVVPFNIPMNFDYVYKTGFNYGNKYNLYWVHIPFSPGATTGTTPLIFIEEESQLIFKDK